MKKVITLALALLMVCSMSVTAFAATTTLTTTVPEATYTLNIPVNQEIPFGTTETSIGNVTVTDSAGFAVGKNLAVTVTYDVFSASGLSTTIPYSLSLYAASTGSGTKEAKLSIPTGSTFVFQGLSNGSVNENTKLESIAYGGSYAGDSSKVMIPVSAIQFSASSEDWSKALASEYTTTITFTAEVVAE